MPSRTFVMSTGTSLSDSARCWKGLHDKQSRSNLSTTPLKDLLRKGEIACELDDYLPKLRALRTEMSKEYDKGLVIAQATGGEGADIPREVRADLVGRYFDTETWPSEPNDERHVLLSAELATILHMGRERFFASEDPHFLILRGRSNRMDAAMTCGILEFLIASAKSAGPIQEQYPWLSRTTVSLSDEVYAWAPIHVKSFNEAATGLADLARKHSHFVFSGGYKAVLIAMTSAVAQGLDRGTAEVQPASKHIYYLREQALATGAATGREVIDFELNYANFRSLIYKESPKKTAVFADLLPWGPDGLAPDEELFVVTTGVSLSSFSRCWTWRDRALDTRSEAQIILEGSPEDRRNLRTLYKELEEMCANVRGTEAMSLKQQAETAKQQSGDFMDRATQKIDTFDERAWDTDAFRHYLTAELATIRALFDEEGVPGGSIISRDSAPRRFLFLAGATNTAEAYLNVAALRKVSENSKLGRIHGGACSWNDFFQETKIDILPWAIPWEPWFRQDFDEAMGHVSTLLYALAERFRDDDTHGPLRVRFLLTGGYKAVLIRMTGFLQALSEVRGKDVLAYYLHQDPGAGGIRPELIELRFRNGACTVDRGRVPHAQ